MKKIFLFLLVTLSISCFATTETLSEASKDSNTRLMCTNIFHMIDDGDASEVNGGVVFHKPEKAYQVIAKDSHANDGSLIFAVYKFQDDYVLYYDMVDKLDLTLPENHTLGEWMEDWELEEYEEDFDKWSNGRDDGFLLFLDNYSKNENNIMEANMFLEGVNIPLHCEALNE